MPPVGARGTKTASVVRVEARTEEVTSFVPSMQASARLRPSAEKRQMFSRTTMELSTIMPTPMAMPPRDIMFSVRSKARISTNTVRMQMGMDTAIVSVAPPRRRNSSTTRAASSSPGGCSDRRRPPSG